MPQLGTDPGDHHVTGTVSMMLAKSDVFKALLEGNRVAPALRLMFPGCGILVSSPAGVEAQHILSGLGSSGQGFLSCCE